MVRSGMQDIAREQAHVAQLREIKKTTQFTFEFQTFADKASALKWLQAEQSTAV
jgi:hypothetical protein